MNKNLTLQTNQEDWYLFIIFIMMAVAIVVKSYFHLDGYLSPDSTSYLKCAQNLLNGKGYYVSTYSFTDQDTGFFAIWPVGYPTLIFLTAKLTGLSVFWASKFLNIILIGVILGIFRALFNKSAYIYGLILLFSAYIEIFSYTWSETIFITAMVWFAASIYFFILSPKKVTLLYLSIMMSSLLLFISRYIGAFSFGLIGLLGLYYGAVMKDKSKSIILIGIVAINIFIMVLYLYHNYTETGFPTGMKRMPSSETNLELFIPLIKALVGEILIPFIPPQSILNNSSVDAIVMFVIQFSILGYLLWKYRTNLLHIINNDINSQSITLSFIFGSIGLVYLIFIVLMRWIILSDDFSVRQLSPGSLLIFIAVIYFLQQRATTQFFHAFKNFLIVFAILSYLLNTPYKAWRSYVNNPTYFQTVQSLEKKYADVRKNSVIIFGPKHLNYLYMDMQRKRPYSLPYHAYKEKWSKFMTRIDPENIKNTYISVPKNELSADSFDQTVIDFVKKYDESTLVKLR